MAAEEEAAALPPTPLEPGPDPTQTAAAVPPPPPEPTPEAEQPEQQPQQQDVPAQIATPTPTPLEDEGQQPQGPTATAGAEAEAEPAANPTPSNDADDAAAAAAAAAAVITTVEERWARLERLASLEGTRRALAALAQAYEAAGAAKGRLAARLEEELADSARQLEAAAAAHRRHVEELRAFHTRRCAVLEEGWARDAGALREEFERERAALAKAHAGEREELRAALAAMDAYERAQEAAAAEGQARLRGLAVARGREAVRALRRSLCAQLEGLEKQLEELQQQHQLQHPLHAPHLQLPAPSSSASPSSTVIAASHRRSSQALLPAGSTAPPSRLASDVARLGQRDQAMVRQLERRVRKVEQYLGQLKEWRARLMSTGREHSERNQALLVEKRALLDQCQKLKRHMAALREAQEAKLRALNEGAGGALDELQGKMEVGGWALFWFWAMARHSRSWHIHTPPHPHTHTHAQLGLRVLHLSELAARKEAQQDELLAMLELPAGADLGGAGGGGGGDHEQPPQDAQEQEDVAVAPIHPAGGDGAALDGSDAIGSGTGGGWEADLAGFWARYNQVLLSKLLLRGARDRLEDEHRHLQVGRSVEGEGLMD